MAEGKEISAEDEELRKARKKASDNYNKAKEKKEKAFVVGGYNFRTSQEAEAAKDEMAAIKYLSSKTDSKDPKQVFILYNKIIDRQLFTTSLGISYLKNLQQFLYQSPSVPNDRIRPIPIKSDTQAEIDRRREKVMHKSEIHELTILVAKYRNKYIKSLIVIGFFAAVIIAMFVIVNTGTNTNIVNYEISIQDKYASWAQELESKEAYLKQKESDLNKLQYELESASIKAGVYSDEDEVKGESESFNGELDTSNENESKPETTKPE